MEDESKHICPQCGTRTMSRVRRPDGKYVLKCEKCGLERGEFKPDEGIGVV